MMRYVIFAWAVAGAPLLAARIDGALDRDRDGFPDAAELGARTDREGVIAWMTFIARSQRVAPSPAWHPDERDCAGLIRFAYREALRVHDEVWVRRTGMGAGPRPDVDVRIEALAGEVGRGAKLFRTGPGAGDWGPFADAETLVLYNLQVLTRDVWRAAAGDVLVYRFIDGGRDRHHTMLVVEAGVREAERWPEVIYHTGLAGERGEVRYVSVGQLARHPDELWHPVVGNARFLGVFRFRILT